MTNAAPEPNPDSASPVDGKIVPILRHRILASVFKRWIAVVRYTACVFQQVGQSSPLPLRSSWAAPWGRPSVSSPPIPASGASAPSTTAFLGAPRISHPRSPPPTGSRRNHRLRIRSPRIGPRFCRNPCCDVSGSGPVLAPPRSSVRCRNRRSHLTES